MLLQTPSGMSARQPSVLHFLLLTALFHVCACVPYNACGAQVITCESWFSSTLWLLGIKPTSSGLAACAFAHGATSSVLALHF